MTPWFDRFAERLRAARPARVVPAPVTGYDRLTRVVLTDEVSRTLFAEYAAHRATDRGTEEIGWVLLGHRHADHAVALATLPAGTNRDAGDEHVRFDPAAQAVAGRMVRQADRRLTPVGVVHTHPGTLRHPSRGDLRGDRGWVAALRGRDGVFGIGTATDAGPAEPHVQTFGGLRFDWYALADGEADYRRLPAELTLGPDLARPLRAVWADLEGNAERLDRLASELARVRFETVAGERGPALAVTVRLADPGDAVRAVLEGKEVRYYAEVGGDVFRVDLPGTPPDKGVYLLLAELAGRAGPPMAAAD